MGLKQYVCTSSSLRYSDPALLDPALLDPALLDPTYCILPSADLRSSGEGYASMRADATCLCQQEIRAGNISRGRRAKEKAIRSHLDPIRSHLDPIRSHLDPIRTRSDPNRSHLDPTRTHLDRTRSYLDPT